MVQKLKIFMNSLTATGHLNSTIGVGQALLKRGHEVIFVIDSAVQKKLEKYGFRVLPLNITAGHLLSNDPAIDFARIIMENGFLGRKSSFEKTILFGNIGYGSTLKVMAEHMVEYDVQIAEYIAAESPDLFIYDQLFYFPCAAKFDLPWIKIISCQPNCFLPDDGDFAPPLSGYSCVEKDKFDAFRRMLKETMARGTVACQDHINRERNHMPAVGEYSSSVQYIMSPYLNIYQYPEELDLQHFDPKYRVFPVDAFVREEINESFQLEPEIKPSSPGEKLIFFSMGSMGGIDIGLMKRLIRILSRSSHKFIVSKGPFGDQFELGANMWGANNVPQTKVLPLVDLVITHGGNNTVCEAFYYGKPMIVMALFADQFDNAQRIQDTGYGLRLEPYDVDEQQMLRAIDALLNDTELHLKLQKVRQRIINSDKKPQLCRKIEEIAYV